MEPRVVEPGWRKIRIAILPLLVFFGSGALWWVLGLSYEEGRVADEKAILMSRLNEVGSLMTSVVNRRQALLNGLEALVRAKGYSSDIETEFLLYAAGIKDNDPSIRALEIFPPDRLVLLYPLAKNEGVAGSSLVNLLTDDRPAVQADMRRTIQSRKITLSDPYVLRQGGWGIVARKAIFKNDELWGLAVVILDLQPLLDDSGVGASSAIAGVSLRDNSGNPFFGKALPPKTIAVHAEVTLPEGSWTISAPLSPDALRDIGAGILLFRLLGLTSSLVLGIVILLILLRLRFLRTQVDEGTRKLDERDEQYKVIFDQSGEGIFVFGSDEVLLKMNPRGRAMLGADSASPVSGRARDFFEPWDRIGSLFQGPSEGATAYAVRSHRLKSFRGSGIDVEVIWHRNLDGAFQGTARDITERKREENESKRAEEEMKGLLDLAERSRLALLGLAEDQKTVESRLRASEELLHETGRLAKVGGWELDSASGVAVWTGEVARIHDLDLLKPMTLEETLDFYTVESRLRAEEAIRLAIQEELPYDLELEIQTARGARKWVRAIGKPKILEGRVIGIRGSFQDITDMRLVTEALRSSEEEIRRINASLESRVAERTAQLEYVNREMEAFTYSVSHDLRAPLRAIDGFSRFLEEESSRNLDEEGLRLLGVIRKNTARMDQLIGDLLDLSKVSRNEIRSMNVDMEALAKEACEELAPKDGGQPFIIEIGRLAPARGDLSLLRQVWHNIVSNAYKYSMKSPERRMEIGSRVEPGGLVYYVRDRGAGFEAEYAGKLFSPFQRLHKNEDFEGNGIGLALVNRIIARHGGRAWAESPGRDRGACFYFSLLEREDAHG